MILQWERYYLRSSDSILKGAAADSNLDDWAALMQSDPLLSVNGEEQESILTSPGEEGRNHKRDTETVVNDSQMFGEFGQFDMGRIHPIFFLKIPASRVSIREELTGIFRLDKPGIHNAQIAESNCPVSKRLGKVHTALICKAKPQKEFEARICLRGDQKNIASAAFASAPTSARDFMRWLIIF